MISMDDAVISMDEAVISMDYRDADQTTVKLRLLVNSDEETKVEITLDEDVVGGLEYSDLTITRTADGDFYVSSSMETELARCLLIQFRLCLEDTLAQSPSTRPDVMVARNMVGILQEIGILEEVEGYPEWAWRGLLEFRRNL